MRLRGRRREEAEQCQRSNDEEHGRTVQPYQSRTGNDDLTGPLGESTPEVIGAVHEDERDADEDRF